LVCLLDRSGHTHTHTHARTHAHRHARMHARTHAHTHARTHKRNALSHTQLSTHKTYSNVSAREREIAHTPARACKHIRTCVSTHGRSLSSPLLPSLFLSLCHTYLGAKKHADVSGGFLHYTHVDTHTRTHANKQTLAYSHTLKFNARSEYQSKLLYRQLPTVCSFALVSLRPRAYTLCE